MYGTVLKRPYDPSQLFVLAYYMVILLPIIWPILYGLQLMNELKLLKQKIYWLTN